MSDGTCHADLGARLAARTLELIDIPSESRDEAALAAHVAGVLRAGGVPADDLGDCGLLAGPPGAPVLLGGHLDTVPAQGNRPGRLDGDRVAGLGASDMKGGVAVALELALAGAPLQVLFFAREELPVAESALTPLLARRRLDARLVVMMEPTDNAIHAGCLGNLNAEWTFRGRSGHSARPWLADNAIERAAAGITALAAAGPRDVEFEGLVFREVASVTRIAGGIAGNVIPDRVDCHVNFRSAPGRTPAEAEARLAELTAGHGELRVTSNAPSGAVPHGNALLDRLIALGDLPVAPKQAWTPVAEFALAGYDAVNFGPGSPAQAHRRDESVEVAALARSYALLERFAHEVAGGAARP
ncbi:MAG TPA: succinyl-diaminopimelate desuccinylase [Solirubrobacteraceae bacterium]